MNLKKYQNIGREAVCNVSAYPSLIIIVFIFLGFNSPVFAQSSWPIFRGTQQLTGFANTELSANPKLLFSFQTEDDIKSSPVVAENTVFCGSSDGKLYAVDFFGKLKWKFDAGNVIEAPPLYFKRFGDCRLDGWLVFPSRC